MVAAKFLINHPSSLLSSPTLTSSSTPFVRERPLITALSRSLAHESYMDLKPQTVFTIEPTSDDTGKAKNKNNSVGKIFKVVFFMLRRRSKKSKASVDMHPDKGVWPRLLGSVRPLHIHGNEEPPPAATVHSDTPSKPKEDFEDSLSMPLRSASRSSSFNTNEYASATNLPELDDSNNDDNNGGDEMIDAKAEEFIAQFYEQMRRQRHDIY